MTNMGASADADRALFRHASIEPLVEHSRISVNASLSDSLNLNDREYGSTEPLHKRRKITVFRPLPMAGDGEVPVAAEHPV
jgi:hypothetical protein